MPLDLFLVRHGQSEGNVALEAAKAGDLSMMTDAYLTRSAADYRLTDLGRAQAAGAGAWLRSWLDATGVQRFDRLYCSPYVRARETAAHLALPNAAWQLEPLLRERDWGLWEGLGRDETADRFPESTAQKRRNRFLWRPESGESTPDLDMRAREVLGTLARELPAGRVLCVTHEDVMWAFRFRLEKLSIEEWIEIVEDDDRGKIPNCGILHYTRVDDSGVMHERFHRVRLVDPADPVSAQCSTIERPRFTNEQLLAQVDEVLPLLPAATTTENLTSGDSNS
ncbi:histidine phosphatase family protein [Actinomarinicola tropica]|nr:histidine phosphatase family protein [Actinomarinicola tropica]